MHRFISFFFSVVSKKNEREFEDTFESGNYFWTHCKSNIHGCYFLGMDFLGGKLKNRQSLLLLLPVQRELSKIFNFCILPESFVRVVPSFLIFSSVIKETEWKFLLKSSSKFPKVNASSFKKILVLEVLFLQGKQIHTNVANFL